MIVYLQTCKIECFCGFRDIIVILYEKIDFIFMLVRSALLKVSTEDLDMSLLEYK